MPVKLHTFVPDPLFGEDYRMLRAFLIALDSVNYHFGRWDWMITHSHLDARYLPKIGLWTEDGKVVAAAMYDCSPGKAFLLTLPGYEGLLDEMLGYAQNAFSKDGRFSVLIPDAHAALQSVAAQRGFAPTQDKEHEAIFDLKSGDFSYALAEGFRVTSMKETYNIFKYGQMLWRGFDHEARGEGEFSAAQSDKDAFERPNVNLDLKIAVVAPDGDFVSYCGMWQDAASQTALVEPVATDPAYRRMGLGRAAVLEGLRRCARLGAKRAVVGSCQQFYYSIGFRPYTSNTYWERKR